MSTTVGPSPDYRAAKTVRKKAGHEMRAAGRQADAVMRYMNNKYLVLREEAGAVVAIKSSECHSAGKQGLL